MTPLEYCRSKAAPLGSSRYYAVYFADPARQPALLALLAYHVELSEIVRECSDPAIATAKLNWWREELKRSYAGQARHPITQALQQPIQDYHLPAEDLEQILEAVAMDIEYGSYPGFKEVSLYLHRMGTAISQLLARVGGYQDPATLRHAHYLGMGVQLTHMLRSVRRDARAGRVYIPQDELQAADVRPEELLEPKTSERLSLLFAQQAARIDDFFLQAEAQLPAVDRWRQRSGIILGELYQALLLEMQADNFPLLEREYHLTPIRKLWLAWRTARRQKIHPKASA